jgi:hypothetical protein
MYKVRSLPPSNDHDPCVMVAMTPGQLLELVASELELIEALISAVADRKTLVTLEAKLITDEIIVQFLEAHAYCSRN